ncbi:hypothetical protein [Falsiroseomonas stagni]|uniref:Uncharacterized protein n=1 Tax=Falsiroseomonas stagni DSM 19981 TaxID=1123062 RepID=A0A1I3XR69_9PROT|nr:hypothetical protein [Falsiroseomonas stagni]SFK21541.1 hypothetical protein SAMN02745775_101535 [Falsiroseomonas stagni DSM 19981]
MATTDMRATAQNTERMTLMIGIGAAILGYVMPAVVFKGTGNAVHDLSMIEKLPVLSALTLAALVAAIATRFVPQWQRWAEQATVVAILMIVAPAIWGFVAAIDVFSGLRPMIVEMAGTRNVRIDPGAGYVPMLIGAALMAFSLHIRGKANAKD